MQKVGVPGTFQNSFMYYVIKHSLVRCFSTDAVTDIENTKKLQTQYCAAHGRVDGFLDNNIETETQ